ncbi:thiol reductant ABC exporter subunit CydC [Bacillus kwashiorkori]|uniref:thiol reductant ABC exporter subunit CydC n=1 Tax=Bacillus kwashiorkori TaxID=1522318 RepID=UPI000782D2B9|nr:thiol reductant ABC exporter subunit CydC [Bacillus kwashiorkori]
MELFKEYIKPYLKQYKGLMLTTVLLGIITVLASSLLTFTAGYLITRASEMPLTILLIYVPIVGVRAFGITRPVAKYLERLAGHNTVLKILSEMRVKLYDMLEPQTLFIRSRFQTGDLLGTLADDIEHLQDAYIRTIFPIVTALFLLLYSVIVLAVFDWLFALWIGLCLSVLVFVYPLLSLYFLKKRQKELKAEKNQLYKKLTDAVFGISDWIVSGNKTRFIAEFLTSTKSTYMLERKMANWNHSRQFQLQVWTGVILIFVGLWAGKAALAGEILPTYIASFTLVTIPIIEGLMPTSQAVERIPAYEESLARINYINKQGIQNSRQEVEIPLPSTVDLVFNHVTFRYGEQENALQSINLSAPFRKKIAILGKSGSGKSTLLQLSLGELSPQIGEVLVNGIKAIDYGDKIHEVISVLNQKPYLFATTVENNIRLGKANATREEIESVIKQVKLDKYIYSLPKGINTQMEETGQRFSGGERQRIALARILLKNTPIVILDEPTVGLDPKTELDLLETIYDVLKDKTVILITHHLIGLEKMDEIIFLDNGCIAMRGSHEQLLQTNQRYKQLYQLDRGDE